VDYLVGVAEIRAMLNVSRQRAYYLTTRSDFPAPEANLVSGKIWRLDKVKTWAAERGRTLVTPEEPEVR
jgi:hypothetical protein